MQTLHPIRRALLSVSDKTSIVEFATALSQRGIKIFSTGGTASLLDNAGLLVIKISDYTGYPEIMGGRVKTLHPKVHGGILGRRNCDEAIMQQHGIELIDMVIVNLYPFATFVAHEECTREDAIENIDIGGSAMVRAAAKNYKDVAIVVNSCDYNTIITEIDNHNGCLTLDTRFDLAVKAFEYTAAYDSAIANYFGTYVPAYHSNNSVHSNNSILSNRFPRTLNLNYVKKQDIRYGENSHQLAAFYIETQQHEASVATAQQLHGKTISYNNIIDTDAALECVKEFNEPACVIVKHTNPCGVATSTTLLDAYEQAYQTDPKSAFGGIIAFNRPLDLATAKSIIGRQFIEVIIAPAIDNDALAIVTTKQNVRMLIYDTWKSRVPGLDFKRVNGGLLVQERDLGMVKLLDLHVVSERKPTKSELYDALFCWKVVKFVKSNAIVYAKNHKTLGIGAGQMSRIDSAKIASIKAKEKGLDMHGSVMASDAFFPFSDGIDVAAAVGVSCVIQPGGSIRDKEVINAANNHGIAMIFTNMRHFRH